MRTQIAMMILSISIFSGCSHTEVVFEDRLICFEQIKIDRVKADMRVKRADEEVALAFRDALDSSFEFYENQVDINNKLCKESKDDSIK